MSISENMLSPKPATSGFKDYLQVIGRVIEICPPYITKYGNHKCQQIVLEQIYYRYKNLVAITILDSDFDQVDVGDLVRVFFTVQSLRPPGHTRFISKIKAWKLEKIK